MVTVYPVAVLTPAEKVGAAPVSNAAPRLDGGGVGRAGVRGSKTVTLELAPLERFEMATAAPDRATVPLVAVTVQVEVTS